MGKFWVCDCFSGRFFSNIFFTLAGYVLFYTVDDTLDVSDWSVAATLGDNLSTPLRGLKANTVYYLKVQANNKQGEGPFSPTVPYKTPNGEFGC